MQTTTEMQDIVTDMITKVKEGKIDYKQVSAAEKLFKMWQRVRSIAKREADDKQFEDLIKK